MNSSKYGVVAVCVSVLLNVAGVAGQDVRTELGGSVVVLPFANLSRHPADDWLGDGLAESVTADLETRGLTVLSRALSPTVAGEIPPSDASDDGGLGRLGRQHRATWAVTGGYQRVGDRLRVTARLVDVATGEVRQAVRVDGLVREIFELQDRIVVELMVGLPGRLGLIGFGLLGQDPTEERPLRTSRARDAPPGPGHGMPMPMPMPTPTRGEVTGGIVVGEGPGAGDDLVPPGDNQGDRAGGFGIASGVGILTGRPSVRPTRTATRPRIDGLLDDPVWQEATRITEFVQQRPLDGAPATEETEIFVAYDNSHLYFGIYAHYSDPRLIRANWTDRDQTFSDDTVAIYFDPFVDQQRAYIFSVNGYGVQADSLLESSAEQARSGSGGGGGGGGGSRPGSGGSPSRGRGGMGAALAASMGAPPIGDTSWDALFASGGTPVEDGWTAEMAIPFKSLRYPRRGPGEPHRWGFQVVRTIPSKDEADVWAPVSRGVAGFLTQMGLLDGLNNLSTSRNLEILPTVTAIQFGSLDATTGAFDEDTQPEGALNVKYGVTPNLTADFTYNPDFSQIESDIPQVEVNQRFPLFFPELRPFFLEGQEVFTVPGQVNLLHTRTIVDPRYGTKLTGKIGNTTLGVLVANDEAPGKRDDPAARAFGKTSQVFVGRARYDLYAESSIGVIATDREFLDSYSRVAGVDGRFRLGRTSSLTFLYAGSQHRDEEGTERSGPTAHVAYNRQGRNLSYGASVDTVDPDFRTDTGFVQRVDTRSARTNVSYRWWPGNMVINWGPLVSYGRIYDFAGVLQDEQASAGMRATFANNVITFANVNRDMERFGGIEFFKTSAFLGGGVSASRKISFGGFLNWGDQIRFSDAPFLGRSITGTAFASLRPMTRLSADLTLITSRLRDPRTDAEVFDVKIFRTFTTYQFTSRLLLRNILEYNTLSRTLGANLLFTYRVNAGTVFFLGYDDHYEQGDLIDAVRFPTTDLQRTNRAFFTKLSYLFRL